MTKWAKRACELVDQIEWYRDVKFRFPTLSCGCDLMISRLDRKLTRVLKPHLTEVVILGEITDADIQRAKDHPIENLIEVKKGKCLCPFHNDRNPSASVKNNKLRCWSQCNKSFDTIEVYKRLHGCSFIDAVKALK